MTHSPDHAERAKEVAKEHDIDWWALVEQPEIVTAMLAYADERVAAALRSRDRVVEAAIRAALHDAAHLQQSGEGVGNG